MTGGHTAEKTQIRFKSFFFFSFEMLLFSLKTHLEDKLKKLTMKTVESTDGVIYSSFHTKFLENTQDNHVNCL